MVINLRNFQDFADQQQFESFGIKNGARLLGWCIVWFSLPLPTSIRFLFIVVIRGKFAIY